MSVPISRSPEATPGSLETGGQRASNLGVIGQDTSQPFGTVQRGIGYAITDRVNTGIELYVTAAVPVAQDFAAGSRVVVCYASLTTGGSELDMSFASVEVRSGATVVLTLDKAAPQKIVTLSGAHEFRLVALKPWSKYSDAPPCATIAVALAE